MWEVAGYRVVAEHGSTLGLEWLDACCYGCIVMVKVIGCIICHYEAIAML